MTSPDSDRSLKIATIVAVVALIVAGSLYFAAMFGSDEADVAVPVAGDMRVMPAQSTSAPDLADASAGEAPTESAETPSGSHLAPMTATLLNTLARPKVMPESEVTGVEEELELVLPAFERCWSAAVGENRRDAQVNVHFTVDESGEVADLSVRPKRLGVPSANACFADALSKRVFGNSEPGTSVYWPILLDPETGPRLR